MGKRSPNGQTAARKLKQRNDLISKEEARRAQCNALYSLLLYKVTTNHWIIHVPLARVTANSPVKGIVTSWGDHVPLE